MNHDIPENESLLSAYLDGELEFELRQALESHLASDPHMADELRRLTELRDLLAGAERPKPKDLSAVVMQRIKQLPPRRPWIRFIDRLLVATPSTRFRFGLGLVAASLIIGLVPILALKVSRSPLPNVTSSAIGSGSKSSQTPQSSIEFSSVTEPIESANPGRMPSQPSEVSAAVKVPPIVIADAATATGLPVRRPRTIPEPSSESQDRVAKLLESPNLRRIFVVTDKVSGTAVKQAADLIEQSARTDYFSISVAQGIVIDPEHPTEAKVFAVAIDDSELDRLRTRLKSTFGELDEDAEPSPELVTQLSEIGEVIAYAPPAAGEIVIPQSDVALKTRAPDKASAADSVHLVAGLSSDPPAFESVSELIHGELDRNSQGRRRSPVGSDAKDLKPPTSADTPDPVNQPNPRSRDMRTVNPGLALQESSPSKSQTPPREAVVLIWIRSRSPG